MFVVAVAVFAVHLALAILGWFGGVSALANLPRSKRLAVVRRESVQRLQQEANRKQDAATAAWGPFQEKIDALQRMQRAF
jgi:hypothetical protein